MGDYDNTFIHDGVRYSLDIVHKYAKTQTITYLPIRELLWVLKYDKPRSDRVAKSKRRFPLYVTRWKGRWCVIDGIHRLERYRISGDKQIPVKVISPLILSKARVS